jgi:hypothetical protein
MAAITTRESEQIEKANAAGLTPVVFIHGLWLLASSWDRWAAVFEEAGYTALAPGGRTTPRRSRRRTRTRRAFAGKTVGQVADHFAEVIGRLERSPARARSSVVNGSLRGAKEQRSFKPQAAGSIPAGRILKCLLIARFVVEAGAPGQVRCFRGYHAWVPFGLLSAQPDSEALPPDTPPMTTARSSRVQSPSFL